MIELKKSNNNVAAIVPAAGLGSRINAGYNKQYIKLLGKPMVVHSVEAVSKHPDVTSLIWVAGADELQEVNELVEYYNLDKVTAVVAGGTERVHSVYQGLQQMTGDEQYVLIHDGARPLTSLQEVDQCLQKAYATGAAIVATPVKDTIKRIAKDHTVKETPPRHELWAAQTPQIMLKQWWLEAYKKLEQDGKLDIVTDDAMMLEAIGKNVSVVLGRYENIKVTTVEDIAFAEKILECRTTQ